MKNNRQILAFDVDGTLCKEVCWTPEECLKATPVKKVIDSINSHHDDAITIIHTARKDELIPATLKWLRDNGVHYWAITNQKLPADQYVDDHAIRPEEL